MCACIYLCMHAHVRAHTLYTYTHIYIHICVYIYTHTYIHIHNAKVFGHCMGSTFIGNVVSAEAHNRKVASRLDGLHTFGRHPWDPWRSIKVAKPKSSVSPRRFAHFWKQQKAKWRLVSTGGHFLAEIRVSPRREHTFWSHQDATTTKDVPLETSPRWGKMSILRKSEQTVEAKWGVQGSTRSTIKIY